jgi:hypothetical protein
MLTRAGVVAELAARLATPLSDAGLAAADTSGALKEPIDDALRMLGYPESDLVAAEVVDDDVPAMLALARYTTLKAVRDRMSNRFDLSARGTSLRLRQAVENINAMLVEAKADVLAIYTVMPSTSANTGIVDMDLNYLSTGVTVVSRDWPYTTIGVGDG